MKYGQEIFFSEKYSLDKTGLREIKIYAMCNMLRLKKCKYLKTEITLNIREI